MEPQPSTSGTDQEPELFAASASEKAITAGKSETDVSDLSALPEDPLSAAPKEREEKESKPSLSSDLVDTRPSTAEQEPIRPESDDVDPNNERTLTKEELIEEALNCPCIASMKEGSCGESFIDAYKCFLQSETEPKGMDCMEQFKTMQSCLAEHPEEYNIDDDDADADPFAVGKDREEQDPPKAAAEPAST